MNNEEILKENNGKKFDICLMNPPYSLKNVGDGTYIYFINKCINITDKLIVVSPLAGFLSHSEHGASAGKNVELHNFMDEIKPEIEEVKNLFDARIKGKVGISVFNKENIPEKIKIKYLNGHIIEVNKQIDIIDNDNEYLKIFKSNLYKYMIGEDISEFINLKYPNIYKGKNKEDVIKIKKDNLFNHMGFGKNGKGTKFKLKIEKNIDKNKYYIFIFKPEANFGEWLYKQTYNEGIKYDEKWFEKVLCYIKCDTKEESKNICSYLRSDFALMIYKLAGKYFHLYLRYDMVPWLDFSKSYTDEELFEMIGMKYDKEEIDKILKK